MSTPATPVARSRRSLAADVVRIVSGNFLEMFDFTLYAYYAKQIAATFFPAHDPFASLMSALVVYGIGYFMRPLGAIVLGTYMDRHGRRRGLVLSLGLMAVGTVAIAATPSYHAIGALAPVLVVAGRLLQGFSAGGEMGGVAAYLAELAPAHRRGLYTAWQSCSLQLATVAAAGLGLVLASLVPPAQITAGAWRWPFFVGCLIIPVIFLLRRSLLESPTFSVRQAPSLREIRTSLRRSAGVITGCTLLVVMTTVTFYTITTFTPTYAKVALHLSDRASMLVTCLVGLSNFVWLPIMGAISDRVGRPKMLMTACGLAILTAYPVLSWMTARPSFTTLLLVNLWFSVIYAAYNASMVVALTELMPVAVRALGWSLAAGVATAVFGGMTPAIATWLVQVSGNKAAPAWWLMSAAAISFVTTVVLYRRGRMPVRTGEPLVELTPTHDSPGD